MLSKSLYQNPNSLENLASYHGYFCIRLNEFCSTLKILTRKVEMWLVKKDQSLYGTEKRELDKNSYQYKYIPVELKSAEHANVLNCKVFPCSMVTSNDSAIFGPTKKCLVDNLSTGPYSSLNLKKSSATLGYSAELKTSALLILGPNLFDNFRQCKLLFLAIGSHYEQSIHSF